ASRWRAKSPDALCAVLPYYVTLCPLAAAHRAGSPHIRRCRDKPKPAPSPPFYSQRHVIFHAAAFHS
ncbi:hypothetical protein, partial [Ruminococcus callidus]|uniref:hypothetical protein n=2 Tax=Ruminococcus callidus TaxID=40519 RepID=UPI00399280F2